MHRRYRTFHEGEVATYIPELARANPDCFAICVATTDGFVYEVGDATQPFTVQSISKPFVYGLALEDNGRDALLAKVGVEPSGDAFNAISLHKANGRPLNPMINAGAIATTGQVRASDPAERFERIRACIGRFAGRPLDVDLAVYESESRTGHRNRAIGHLLRNFDVLTDDPMADVEVYFRQCAISVTCRDLALMAATLANHGQNPITGERAISGDHVECVLSVMASCGMYDYAGGWIYHVGMPAKSGVAGGVLAVLPGQLGIGVFSPRLDVHGNSARAIKVCEELSRLWDLHQFDPPHSPHQGRRLTFTAADHGSSRSRSAAERHCLQQHGAAIRVLELQGSLVFSSAEPIVRDLAEEDLPALLVLDCHHVTSVNDAAATLLSDLADRLATQGTGVLVTHVEHLTPLAAAFRRHDPPSPTESRLRFSSTDDALEWCEDVVLERHMPAPPPRTLDRLADHGLAHGLTAAQIERLAAIMKPAAFRRGERLVTAGDEATSIILITRGLASAWIAVPGGPDRRLATFTAGAMVGEMAFAEESPRSATVVAESEVECLVLHRVDFDTLRDTDAAIHAVVWRNIARAIADKLRKANHDLGVYDHVALGRAGSPS
ncbi:MAG: glutaminase A [Planctomycetaceae bacterium]